MDPSSPGRPRPRLGRLALVCASVGVVAYGAAALIHWRAFSATGAVRYSTEPTIDWLSIAFVAGPVLIVTAGVAVAAAIVLALIVLVRRAVPRHPTRAS